MREWENRKGKRAEVHALESVNYGQRIKNNGGGPARETSREEKPRELADCGVAGAVLLQLRSTFFQSF